MGVFGKGKTGSAGAEKDLARAIAKRGVPGEARITAMTPTGRTRANGAAREIEFRLLLEAAGTTYEPVARQFMDELSLTGLAPGEPVSVLYDRGDPAVLIVLQSPRYVFVPNPAAVFGGPTMIAVPAAGPRGTSGQLPAPLSAHQAPSCGSPAPGDARSSVRTRCWSHARRKPETTAE